jgi:hypothetical protein
MLLDDVLMVIPLAGMFLAGADIRAHLKESRRLMHRCSSLQSTGANQ